jgi:hypothetical protein
LSHRIQWINRCELFGQGAENLVTEFVPLMGRSGNRESICLKEKTGRILLIDYHSINPPINPPRRFNLCFVQNPKLTFLKNVKRNAFPNHFLCTETPSTATPSPFPG